MYVFVFAYCIIFDILFVCFHLFTAQVRAAGAGQGAHHVCRNASSAAARGHLRQTGADGGLDALNTAIAIYIAGMTRAYSCDDKIWI